MLLCVPRYSNALTKVSVNATLLDMVKKQRVFQAGSNMVRLNDVEYRFTSFIVIVQMSVNKVAIDPGSFDLFNLQSLLQREVSQYLITLITLIPS